MGAESLDVTPFRDWDALAVHRFGLGRAAFLHEFCQVKLCNCLFVRPKNSHVDFNQELDFFSMLYSHLNSLHLGIYESFIFFTCHLGLLYREFVGTITPASTTLLMSVSISFFPAGVLYCFNLRTSIKDYRFPFSMSN